MDCSGRRNTHRCQGCVIHATRQPASRHPWSTASRAELAKERASRPASDGASAQQLAAAHRAEVAAAAAAAAHARSDAEELRDALAARDAELQRLQARPLSPAVDHADVVALLSGVY